MIKYAVTLKQLFGVLSYLIFFLMLTWEIAEVASSRTARAGSW